MAGSPVARPVESSDVERTGNRRVVIPFVRTAFGTDGQPADPETDIRLQVMLDDLAWWSSALERARAAGELPPGSLRARAALAATQA